MTMFNSNVAFYFSLVFFFSCFNRNFVHFNPTRSWWYHEKVEATICCFGFNVGWNMIFFINVPRSQTCVKSWDFSRLYGTMSNNLDWTQFMIKKYKTNMHILIQKKQKQHDIRLQRMHIKSKITCHNDSDSNHRNKKHRQLEY